MKIVKVMACLISATLLFGVPVIADESVTEVSTEDLLERIEQLEARVAVLEKLVSASDDSVSDEDEESTGIKDLAPGGYVVGEQLDPGSYTFTIKEGDGICYIYRYDSYDTYLARKNDVMNSDNGALEFVVVCDPESEDGSMVAGLAGKEAQMILSEGECILVFMGSCTASLN